MYVFTNFIQIVVYHNFSICQAVMKNIFPHMIKYSNSSDGSSS
ncbi:hypothetical protein CLOSTASPAR_02808 [[Clostridium] asparagiforme DSM 15981]|uniref:Uncharacterized protein n=1 Tax=[Clostridium] asparagiforme DSM 15981 TaxID=518636 RepID=C0D0M2_9FIRM|nr:hypothetical protein CLOSTASPAR_02808 [[Clostridium] asparagiforme DSM 15981]